MSQFRAGWARHAIYEILQNIPAINPDVNLGRKLTCRVVRPHLYTFQHIVERRRLPAAGISKSRYIFKTKIFTIARRGAPFVHRYNKEKKNILLLKLNTNGAQMIPILVLIIFLFYQNEAKTISSTPSKFVGILLT